MKKVLLFLGALLCITLITHAQPTVLYTGLTSTTPAPSNSRFTLNTVGGFRQFRFQANQTASASTIGWAFHIGTTGSPNYNPCWRPYTGGNTLSVNTFIPTSFANGARYNTGGGGADGLLPAITSGNYYTFNVSANAAADNVMSLLETTYDPVLLSGLTRSAGNYGTHVFTVTASSAPSSGENVFLRYSTNGYTTSTIVQFTFVGTTGTATVPALAPNSTLVAYAYSSNKSQSTIESDVSTNGQSAHDMASLNLSNGVSYSVPNNPVIVTSSAGSAAGVATGYATMNAAFTAINGGAIHLGVITIALIGNTTETVSAAINQVAGVTSIGIQPAGGGARTISGAIAGGSPLIDLNGADNVTIDGLNSGGNSLTISNTTVSTTASTSTIRFIGDATSNTIQNCTISGSSTVSNSVSVLGGTIIFSTGTTTGNDGNIISNNTITSAGANLTSCAISSVGTSAAVDNSGIQITNNNIQDYYSAANNSFGILAGNNNSTWTISGNRFYQSATRTATAGSTHVGMRIQSGNGYVISNNVIGFANSSGTGTTFYAGAFSNRFIGIDLAVGTTTATSVQGNTISGINLNTTSGAPTNNGIFTGIYVTSGNVNIGTTTGNTLGNTSSTNFIFITATTSGALINGISSSSTGTVTIQNNTISSFGFGGTAAIGYVLNAIVTSGTAGIYTISNNIIGSTTTANSIGVGVSGTTTTACTFYAIRNSATGASSITNNTIQNCTIYGTGAHVLRGIDNSGSASTLVITGNSLLSFSYPATTSGTFTAISNSGTVTTSINISNNFLGNASAGLITYGAANSGALNGISNSAAAAACTLTINSNDIRGIVHSVAGSSSHTYISWTHASSTTDNINNNTFTNLNVNTTGSVTFISGSGNLTSTGVQNTNSNSIVTGFSKTGAGGTVTLYNNGSSSVNGSVVNNNSNDFSNITLTGNTTMAGWSNTDGASTVSGPNKSISSNTFTNWTCGSSPVTAISANFGNNGSSVSNNTISNISGSNAVTAVVIGSSNGGSAQSCSSNTITNLTSTGTGGSVAGISGGSTSVTTMTLSQNTVGSLSSTTTIGVVSGITLSAGATTNVTGNKVYDLSGNQAASVINGINVASGTTFNINNNLVGDLRATAATGLNAINGLNLSATATYNVHYNTIYLNATSSSVTTFGSTCILFSSTATTLDLRDNILANLSTPAQNALNTASNGISACLRRSAGTGGTVPSNYNTASNNNAYWCNPTAGTNNHMTYVEGTSTITNPCNTVIAMKTFMVNRDQLSVQTNPTFLSTTGSNSNFLHIDTGVATPLESGGVTVAGITTDFDGNTRNVTTPDIGADEFAGIPADVTAPTISYTALGITCSTGDRTLSGVTISDATKVDTTSTYRPRIYYRKNAGSYFSSQGTLTAGNPSSGTWSFTIIAADMGGLVASDVVSYFVIAQDSLTVPNVISNPSAGLVATDVNTVTTPPTSPNSYAISTTLSGTYTVGAAGTYTTLDAAFTAYNTSCLGGAVIFSLIDNSYAVPTVAINANQDASATNTLTIKPTLANTTISGSSGTAVIKLNGADFVIIDGSINTGTNNACPTVVSLSRDLTISNTSTATGTAVIWLSSAGTGAGATNNVVKNCILSAGVNQSTSANITYGIIASGATIGLAVDGADNNANIFENNRISTVSHGIYVRGAAASYNSGNVARQNLIGGNAFGATQVGTSGITMTYQTTAAANYNEVRFVGNIATHTTNTNTRAGISLLDCTSSSITHNSVHDIADEQTRGAYGISVGASSNYTTTNTVANNMIYNVRSNGTTTNDRAPYGIAIGPGDGDRVVNNSILMTGDLDPTGATVVTQRGAGIRVNPLILNTVNLVLANNIVHVDLTSNNTVTQHAIILPAIGANFSTASGSGNNNYYVNTSNAAMVLGGQGLSSFTNIATLAAWQGQYAFESASDNIQPVFTSATDLHLNTSSINNLTFENTASVISGVTTDFDCDTRNVTTPDVGADEFTSTLPADDGAVTSVSVPALPCPGSSTTISVTIQNTGSATLNTLLVDWTLNGVNQTQASYTGLGLASGASTTLTLGSATLSATLSNAIVATCSLPNGVTDPTSGNNTFTLSSVTTSLTGTYTVGTGGDFTTITAAVSAYNTRGICGPTVFSLINTTNYSAGETFPFTINAAAGASATNTLTIRPATGVDAVIQGQALTNTIFILNGADYVTIDGNNAGQTNPACGPGTASRNLTIRVVSTGTSAVVWLQSNSNPDAATNNIIRNCIIEGNSSTSTLVGIGSGNSTISITSLGTGNNNNTFENNEVRKVQYGIYSQGFNSGNKNTGNRAIQNVMDAASANNIGRGGIIFGYEDNAVISNNSIGNISVGGDAFGISLGATGFSGSSMSGNEVTNTLVNGNTIGSITASGTNSAFGILSCTGITSGWTNTISNNMISGVISNATPADITAGIALGGGPGTVRVYHNTVLMQGDRGAGTTAHSYALAVLGSTPLVDIQNNILVNTQTTASTGRSYAIGLAYSSVSGNYTNLVSNNNDLIATGSSATFARRGSLGTSGGTDIANLAAWNAETGRDGASISYSPGFISTSNLRIDNLNLSNVALDGTAAPLASVTTDIDCAARNVTTPDMGADEFAIPVCSGTPTAGTAVATGPGPFCGSGTSVLSLTGSTPALGLTYQWQSSVTGTLGSYSDIGGATSNTYSDTNISTSTWYQCVVTCTNSGLSAVSTAVQVVVNPSPNVTVTPSSGLICGTGSVALAASGASTYTWSPTVGLSPTTGANVTSNVGATTTYTVTGTDVNGCTGTAQTTVVFSPAVPAFTATATPNPPCSSDGLVLGTTVANTSAVVYNENFDGTINWTALNNSTGGTPADAAWTQRSSGYVYSSTTFTTGDASPFMMSNSDDQGSGTTNTSLTSPPIDLTDLSTANIVLNHYFRLNSGETARVQVSTDGSIFTTVQTFTATTGAPAAFVNSTININAYAGLPTVYIRLQYDATFDWYWAVNNVAVSGNLLYNYSWSSTPTGFTSTLAGPTAEPTVPTLYSVTITNALGCTGNASVNVASIVQAADVDAGAATASTCVNTPISFTGTQNNTTGVVWTHNGNGTLANATTLNPTYTPGALDAGNTVTITLTGTANAPCTNAVDVISLNVLALGVFYTDADGDGFGNPFAPISACSAGPGVVADNTDCNDSNAALNPFTNWYADMDGDGYGSFIFLTTCSDPLLPGVVLQGGDCDDTDNTIFPGGVELCQNGIDDDCDGLTDEGCSGIANDNWADAIAVTGSLSAYPVCTALNGTVLNADVSPQGNPANVAVGGGRDVWYKFTSPSTGVQIKVVPTGFDAVIELQTSLGAQVDVENVNTAVGGNEIMNRASLTEGAQYWVGVRNYNNTAGGTFTICISPLLDSRCDEGPGTYAMCSNFKADYSGATNYTFHFTPTGVTPGSPSSGVHPSQIPLNTPLDVRYGGTYDVYVDANFPNLVNGIGGADPIVIVGTDVCPITIAAQPDVQVRESQRCPATVLRTTRLNAKPFICGPIVNFEYRFTEINCSTSAIIGIPFSKFTPTASPNLLLSFNSPSLVPGSCYNVEVRPIFSYGPGTWGTAQCIKIGSPSATEMDVTELLNGSGLAEDEIEAMLYPNPNNGDLVNLQIDGIVSDEVYVRVTDGMGRLIYTERFMVDGSLNTMLNFTSPLGNGLYLVEIVSNGKITTRKMLVQK